MTNYLLKIFATVRFWLRNVLGPDKTLNLITYLIKRCATLECEGGLLTKAIHTDWIVGAIANNYGPDALVDRVTRDWHRKQSRKPLEASRKSVDKTAQQHCGLLAKLCMALYTALLQTWLSASLAKMCGDRSSRKLALSSTAARTLFTKFTTTRKHWA